MMFISYELEQTQNLNLRLLTNIVGVSETSATTHDSKRILPVLQVSLRLYMHNVIDHATTETVNSLRQTCSCKKGMKSVLG